MPVTPSLNCRTSTITSGCSNNASAVSATISTPMGKILEMETNNKDDEGGDIEVDELDRQSMTSKGRNYAPPSAIVTNNAPPTHEEDDEDVEVFIDTTSEDADVVVECDIQQKISFKNQNHKTANTGKESAAAAASSHHSSSHGHNRRHDKTHKKSSHSRSDKRRKSGNNNSLSSTGLQVAKAPIPASQLDTSEANKVIIDVASCDGPVRFKRILNTAYGHKPETCSAAAAVGSANHHHMNVTPGQERSLQSVSLSFHQQMAKTISQQQHLNNAEESENSETSNGSIGTGNNGGGGGVAGAPKLGRKIQNEIFVCVYCKHTFKSQYCYQKHAKRHLNPLTLQATCVPPPEKRTINDESSSTMTTTAVASSSSSLMATTEQQSSSNLQKIRPFVLRNSGMSGQQSGGGSSTSADFLRREVRPLDMNVQYYPCKTCGCKFPSYYFVHKHRKMCHAEEEAAAAAAVQQNVNGNNGGAGTGTSTSSLEESAQTANEDDNHHMDEEAKEKN
ncbi:uncharacterized protein LOC131802601 [Musca domestica]|uniref:Uncharacterized protein LOC131802601 n=1 Tax=Musca domestica TaxID=7370 RepID=A0ABM3UZH2_MUSDO|nr:uncharacterized protein LOC131802601 [Musca domestica]